MAKMNDVQYGVPANFLSGLGQYDYSFDDMLMGMALGWLGASDDDILMGLSGVGRMALPQPVNAFTKMSNPQLATFVKKNPGNAQARSEQMRRNIMGAGASVTAMVKPPPGRPVAFPQPVRPPMVQAKPSVMNAIIKNAAELNAKKQVVAAVQKKAAAASPLVALKLAKDKKKVSAPGSNEIRAISNAINTAAKKAVSAKKDEAAAKVLLAQSDKRGAAAKAVSALSKAREAAILANKAEKTRLTRGLDLLANTLKAQADYLDNLVKMESSRAGANPRTMALSATAQSLRETIKRLKAQSGVVAAMPTVPANAPSNQRIAELANKFNIRTAKKDKFMLDKAVVSVLGDLSEAPLAQVDDYEGAVMYYGVDGLGQMMADMEFENYGEAMGRLSGLMGGIGYTDSLPTLAQSDELLQAATVLAQNTYSDVVLPAAGLGGLSRIDENKVNKDWDKWCDEKAGVEYPADLKNKCREGNRGEPWGCDLLAPYSLTGKGCRGLPIDWAKAVMDIPKAVAKAAADVKKVTADVKNITGAKPSVPAAAKPPVEVPKQVAAPAVEQAVQKAEVAAQTAAATASTSSGLTVTDKAPAAGSGIPLYVYAIGGVAVAGAAAYFLLMRPKADAAPAV